MKIEEICRTCLSESSDLRSIFKLGVIAGKTTTLSKVLMEFTKLSINESDCFPDKMCYGCVIQANQSFAFLQTCLESDRYLREKLGKAKHSISTNDCNDENTMTEAETQTVYLYNAINIEGENEINVHIEPSEIKIIKKESLDTEQNNSNGAILLTTEDPNESEPENVIPDIIEDDNLETEILEEIDNEGGNSNSSFDNMHHEYYEEHNSCDDMKNDSNKSMEDLHFEVQDENLRIIKVESDDIIMSDDRLSDEIKKKRKIRSFAGKINVPGPPYVCSICRKHLSTRSSYKYHMQLHSDATPFLCNECGEGFKTRNAYEGHMTTHDINNPHKCNICGKIYRQANSLKTHMLTHTGEKPFLCGICGKGMTQKSGFKKHMLVHSGEMPFECEICHKKFRYSSNLIAHKKTHERLCKICDKLCSSPSELKKHIIIHATSSQNTVSSSLVYRNFTKLEALKTHIKLVHKQEHAETEIEINSKN